MTAKPESVESVGPVVIHTVNNDPGCLRIVAEHPVVPQLAGELVRLLKAQEATNYVEMRLIDQATGEEYAVLVQRVNGMTPAQKNVALEASHRAELAEALAEADENEMIQAEIDTSLRGTDMDAFVQHILRSRRRKHGVDK